MKRGRAHVTTEQRGFFSFRLFILIVTIGVILAIVFAGSVFSLLYALLFITQPMAQAPNDAAFIDLVSTLCVFLTGTLAGILSANGLKSKPKPPVEEPEGEAK
jgi:uncharacterized BrkB/YihY/UPF0761 family membrane protein